MLSSLIVIVLTASQSLAGPVKYLGLVSPLYPLRTALDVFQPSPGLAFPFRLAGFPGYFSSYYPQPWTQALPSSPVTRLMTEVGLTSQMTSHSILSPSLQPPPLWRRELTWLRRWLARE